MRKEREKWRIKEDKKHHSSAISRLSLSRDLNMPLNKLVVAASPFSGDMEYGEH